MEVRSRVFRWSVQFVMHPIHRVYDSFALVEMEVADQFFYSFPFATAFGCS